MVSTIYFDMDGVLSDLDGAVASFFGISKDQLRADWQKRNDRHLERISKIGLRESYLQVEALRHLELKDLMRTLRGRGFRLEILSALGVQPIEGHSILSVTSITHGAKIDWLAVVYGDLFEEDVLSRFNSVPNCEVKSNFGHGEALLIDDQPGNVDAFKAKGGKAILYHTENHDDCVRQLWDLLK